MAGRLVVDAAPGQTVTRVCGGKGVLLAGCNADDFLSGEALDDCDLFDDGVIFAGAVDNAGLAEVIHTPCPDVVISVDGE